MKNLLVLLSLCLPACVASRNSSDSLTNAADFVSDALTINATLPQTPLIKHQADDLQSAEISIALSKNDLDKTKAEIVKLNSHWYVRWGQRIDAAAWGLAILVVLATVTGSMGTFIPIFSLFSRGIFAVVTMGISEVGTLLSWISKKSAKELPPIKPSMIL